MKYKYNNQWKDLTVKAGDTLPVGTIVDYDGDTVPSGYEEVEETEDYSTSETNTGKKWIDGKPIYRIVKNYESLSSRINNSAPIDVTSLNIDTFTDIKGETTNKRSMLLGDSQAITWNTDKTSIIIYFNNSGADTYSGYVIIEYTKTTD